MVEGPGPAVTEEISTHRDEVLRLRDYADILRRRRLLFGVVLVLVVGAVAVWTAFRTPVYEASARVIIRSGQNQQLFPYATGVGGRFVRFVSTELDYVASDEFSTAAEQTSVGDATVTTSTDESAAALVFTARSTDRQAAAVTANAWADSYIELRHIRDVSELEAGQAPLQAIVQSLEAEIAQIQEPLDALDRLIESTADPQTLATLTSQRLALFQSLTLDLTPLQSELRSVKEQLATINVDLQLRREQTTLSARLAAAASPPSSPAEPNWPRNMALASIVALVLATGTVLVVESSRSRVVSVDEVADAVGAPVLASIPDSPPGELSPDAVLDGRSTAVLEAFQRLVSALVALNNGGIRSVLVTSPRTGEGKSTVAANAAAILARQGLRVLLLDADLRRPRQAEIFGLDETEGLAGILQRRASWAEAVGAPPHHPNLGVIQAGTPSRNPADLLRQDEFDKLLADLDSFVDLTIVDSPPTGPVADSLEIGRRVDGAIIIGRPGITVEQELSRAADLLRSWGAPVIGAVVTAAPTDSGYSYYSDRKHRGRSKRGSRAGRGRAKAN